MSEAQSSFAPEAEVKKGLTKKRAVRFLSVAAIPLTLVVMTFGVFRPAIHCDFINYDDPYYVTVNHHVNSGLTLAGIVWAFCTNQTANWHPLTWLSHMIDVSLFGLNPGGHHLTNVLIHCANGVLVFVLLMQLTGVRWRSATVAALFALHPVHVESVAWIAERKDVLSTFFGLLSLLFYARYAKGGGQVSGVTSQVSGVGSRTRNYRLAFIFFVLGLMSKPMLVTLPFVMLLLDFWPLNRMRSAERGVRNGNSEAGKDEEQGGKEQGEGREQKSEGRRQKWEVGSEKSEVRGESEARKAEGRRQNWSLITEKWPFFLLSAVFCVITFQAQKGNGAVVALTKIPFGMRIENAFVSYARYLGKLFWPETLALPYPYPTEWPIALVMGGVLITVGCFATALWLARKWPFVTTGWFWFFGTLIPVIGLVQVGNQPLADRYCYLPSIGIFILVTWSAWALIEMWVGKMERSPGEERELPVGTGGSIGVEPLAGTQSNERLSRSGVYAASGVVVVAILMACGWRTREQLSYWQNSETLFGHAVKVTKNNGLALDSLGSSLLYRGKLDEAMTCYRAALEIHPKDPLANDGVGCCLFSQGKLDEAIQKFKKVIETSPNQYLTLFNLASALAQQGHYDEAIPYFKSAMKLQPDDADISLSLGNVYLRQQKFADAIGYYRQAVRLAPENVTARRCLAAALYDAGRVGEAGIEYTKLVQLNHRDADAHLMIARIHAALGHQAEARMHALEVLKIKPGDPAATELLEQLQK